MAYATQCENWNECQALRCCYHAGHSGDCFYSREDETDRIRWKLASDQRDRQAAEIDALRAELDGAWEAASVPVRGMVTLAEVITNLRQQRDQLRIEVEKWKRYKAAIDEALNSGDGTYRP